MNNLAYLAKITNISGRKIILELKEELNIERLKTIFNGFDGERQAELFIKDPRGFTPQQRRFVFALMQDIYIYTGEPLESLKDVFYWQFRYFTGKNISLSNESENTVDEVSTLSELILDFIFENDIPFREGYEIAPQNVGYYFYKCVMTRTCCVCGKKHADIHHVDSVGMGNNRKKIDNSGRRLMALCRTCHTEIHLEGFNEFTSKRQLIAVKISKDDLKRLGLSVFG